MLPADAILPKGKLAPEFLHELFQRYVHRDARVIAGPGVGEDVAVVDMGDRYMVVKTDPITFATDQIGWYAVHVNANDVATSGARPLWMLNTVLLPEGRTHPGMVEDIFAQLDAACTELGIVLVGGHTEVAWGLERPIVVGVLIGEVAKERLLTTTAAQVGDHLLLVKGIPIEATAIIAREKAAELAQRGLDAALIERAQRYLYDPGISIVAAAQMAAAWPGVHAMHDPTEGGLATGVHEMATAAGTGVRLVYERIPILPEGARLCAEFGLDPMGAIASGALLVAVMAERALGLVEHYRAQGIPCNDVGELVPSEQGRCLVMDNQARPLPRFDSDEIARLF